MPPLVVIACACALAGGCAAATAGPAFELPRNVVVLDGPTGQRMAADELLRRMRAADLVLLGEVHDNGVHHAVRGNLITALRERRPAIVFEQFAESREPIRPPATGEDIVGWLDRNGFDREGWKWPLHRPVVDAAIRHGAALWGSGISREALRSVVREGESAAPAHLREAMMRAPLDGVAQAALDHELAEGHCGQMPASMVVGMRAAQVVRDASMATALVRAATTGPAWLIAGNGHVRRDIAVPRILRAIAPGRSVLVVGFLERPANGGEPSAAARGVFDIVIVTPRVERADPCAEFRR